MSKAPRISVPKINVGSSESTYKSRSARPQFYNERLLDTESTDMTARQGHILLQKNLQIQFLAQENEDLRNKVQNLENVVQANKQMMQALVSTSSQEENGGQKEQTKISSSTTAAAALEVQLRRQSEHLLQRNAELEKQLEDKSAQILVMTQIIQNFQNQDDATDLVVLQEKQVMIDDMNHKEYLLQKYEMKIYHYEKYLLKKGQLENEARQLLQHFRLEVPLHDQKVSNTVSDNIALRKQLAQSEANLRKIKEVREKDKKTISDLNNTIENMMMMMHRRQQEKAAAVASHQELDNENDDNGPNSCKASAGPDGDFFKVHQLEMMGSLKLSVITGEQDAAGGVLTTSGWTNDQMRKDSITADVNGFAIKPKQDGQTARRDTIQEIVQSFN